MTERIISHMNADHSDSLKLFLQHYCGVSARSVKLTNITLDHMIVESNIGRNFIPINPPMKGFNEARERMVAMHHESVQGLGLSDIKITSYAGPNRIWQWALSFLCLWCYITLPFPEKLRPESSTFMSYGWSLGNRIPALTQAASDLAFLVLPGMLGIHAVEASYMWWSRLRKHGLQPNNPVTWLWFGNALFSGFGCIGRFDDLVKEKEIKQRKH